MGAFGAGLGAAAGNLEANWGKDRQTKRDIMKARVIHEFNMTGRKFTQGAMDKRATERQAHERGLLTDRIAANQAAAELNQKQRTDAASLANRRSNSRLDREIANRGSESVTDSEGKVWERRPGGGPWTQSVTETGPTQYQDDETATAGMQGLTPEWGVSSGLLSGMQDKGKREQLNTGRGGSVADKRAHEIEIAKIKKSGDSSGAGGGSAYQKKYQEMLKLNVPANVARGVAYGTIKDIKDEYGYTSALVDLATGTTIGNIKEGGGFVINPEWTKQSKSAGGGQAGGQPPAADIDKSNWTADWSGSKFKGRSWEREDGLKFTMNDILKQAQKSGHTPERVMKNIGIDPKSLLTGK